MLRGLRQASSNWLGKTVMTVVMGVLIVSFGVWGIADIFKGFGQSSLAKIGSTEISTESFRQTFNERLQEYGRQFGRSLTPAQARAFGLDRQILQQVIADAALDDASRRMRLGLPNSEIVKAIAADPLFKGPTGSFEPARFNELIRQIGYSEARFVAEQRRVLLRRQVSGSVVAGLTVSKTQLDALNRFQNEQRSLAYVRLDAAQAGTIEPPSDDVLKAFFEDRKALFRAPEYRKITVASITPDDIAKWMTISDDDARKVFEQTQSRYVTPEKRQVHQLVFPDAAEAAAAREKLAAGTSFEDLAKERGLNVSDTDLGLVTKSAIIDPLIADAAFALPLNELSQPIAGRFGTAILKITKIEPGNAPAFETVAQAIKRDIALDRARSEVQSTYNKMEDERGGGTPVGEAAKKLNITATTIEAVDRSGRSPDGAPVTGLPAGVDIIPAVFNSDVGVENDPISVAGGYVWFDVLDVVKSRERTFDEVKDQVTARWRDEQVSKRLKDKADEIAATFGKEGPSADLAAISGLKVETATGVKRGAVVPGLSPGALTIAFSTPKDAVGIAPGTGNEWIVLRVTDVSAPTIDAEAPEIKSLRDNLQRILVQEQTTEYVLKLESEIGTSINEQAFAQATGAASSDPSQQQ